uniref:uncharacterized protein LOC117606144 isoform X1 n=1 Tax=Osmia lignaria TaxID=473952 RepID=UPI0014789DB3|nr:uncharacterized protein LOC117606144 isoform X1 [Osmia lignaria]
MEAVNVSKQQSSSYQKHKKFLLRSFATKGEFVKEYKKLYNEKAKTEELFLMLFIELEKTTLAGDINSLKKLNHLINYIREIEDQTALQDYYNNTNNPIKNTNLVILACKENKQEILKYLLDNKILTNLSMNIKESVILPDYEDEASHNAFYYAIRSGNIELLDTLIHKWPGNYFTSHLEELDEILSRAYEELKLKNIPLSDKIEIFVESKLINLRFFSNTSKQGKSYRGDLNNIKERIELIIQNISLLKTEYIDAEKVDTKFLFIAKFIAQNIHILKQQLKSTYNIIPWEEMEFCLICFVSSYIKQQEINLFYFAILDKRKILNQLQNFGKKLEEVKNNINTMDISKFSDLPKLKRQIVVASIISNSPEFEELYTDYQQIRDMYSLDKMNDYVQLALAIDPTGREGQLIITRVLQVIGEYFKNTLESPKLSNTTSEFFLLSLPKYTREVVIDLRNSFSHAYSLSKRTEIEKNTDVNFFIGIQNDIRKFGEVVTNIFYGNKIKMIRILLQKLIDSQNVDEIKEIIGELSTIKFDKMIRENCNITELEKLEELIEKLSDNVIKSIYEKQLFDEINNIIHLRNSESTRTRTDYVTGFITLQSLSVTCSDTEINHNMVRGIKFFANNILQYITPQIKSRSLKEIAKLVIKIAHSVKSRIQDEMYILEIYRIIYKIVGIIEFEINDIKWIESLREKLHVTGTFIPMYKQRRTDNKISEIEHNNQLELKLSELQNILNTNALNEQLIDKSSSYKQNEKLQVVIKMLVLDIMSILGSLKNYLEDDLFFLDYNTPLLTGKCLRNYLAHDNALVHILLLDPSISVILNATKLTTENILKKKKKIGKLMKEDISKLKDKYGYCLAIVSNQKQMFVALEEGNLENLKDCIKKGADIHARDNNMWTTVHFAAKGSSLEVVKFILNQNVSLNVKNINGQSPLHIAALYGRANIVKFFVEETELCIDDRDNNKKTPLHTAAENGNKNTVEILLMNGANINTQDLISYPPSLSAVRNNHIDVVKVLLKNEVDVDFTQSVGGFSMLHVAAEFGHQEIVDFLLKKGANVNARNDRGGIPLHTAALNGHLEVVNTLILNGADVNARVLHGCTSLHYAIENGHEKIANILLEHGANANVSDKTYNNTPLHYAAMNGHERIVEALLENNANTNITTVEGFTPLHLAVQNGHLEIVTTLLKHSTNINVTAKRKEMLLHYAAEKGYKEIAELLIKNGAEVNAIDDTDLTPLHLAALRGHKDVIDLLIENKAKVNIQNINGCTPLHAAVENGNKDICDLLIKNKAKVNAKNNCGVTPLHTAAAKGDKNIIDLLIKNKAEVNAKCDDGTTPLNVAATCGHEDNVILLIKNAAIVNNKGIFGFTPLHSAIMGGYKDVVNLLIENNAEINAVGVGDNTPLHLAVEIENKGLVEILIRNGANVNAKNGNNMTPLCCAIKKNSKEIVEVLVVNGADVNVNEGEPLSLAVFAGYKDIINVLLQNNARIDIKFRQSMSALHTAAERGHTEIANTLIANGADVNVTADTSHTPLHLAADGCHKEMVELLLSKGANVNAQSMDGTPLHLAVTRDENVDVVRVLLKNGADVSIRDPKNRRVLEQAVAYKQLDCVKALLLHNKKININAKCNDDWTILHIAAQAGNLEMVKYLINEGCDVNARNAAGSKPIHIAAREGFKDIVKFFLSKDCSIDDLGAANQTLLHYAAMKGQVEAVKHLIAEGADINIQDRTGLSPLHIAANNGYEKVVEILLENGAVYNTVDKFSRTPREMANSEKVIVQLSSTEKLFEAVKRNNSSEVEKCIRMGAFVNAKHVGAKGYVGTPLHFAAWKGYDEIINILLKNKANPNATGNKAFTPLHYAAKFSHLKIVMILLSNGAIYNAISDDEKTPFHFAADKNVNDLLKLVGESFRNVRNGNSKVIYELNKIKNIDKIKAIMSASDREKQSLIVAAMHSSFPKIEQLKLIGQGDISTQIDAALLFANQENYNMALRFITNALERRTEILGPYNPATLEIQTDIAKILYKQGSFQVAVELLDEIYQKQKETLGLYHKDTLNTRSTFALIIHRQGKNDEALDIYQEIYKKQKELLGPRHEDTMNTQFHMALVLDKQEKYEEALEMNKDVFQKRKEIFGANHRVTISAQNNIAMVLGNQGKYEEALKMYKIVLEKKRTVLGKNHSDTLRTLFNMAGLHLKQKKYDESLKAHQELFDIQKTIFGESHPDTLNTQYNLANTYFWQGKFISALKIYSECLEKRSAVFGPTHPTVLNIKQHIELINDRFKMEGSGAAEIIGYLQKEINIAASKGDVQTIRNLLRNGADVNDKDVDGRVPLHYAVGNGYTDVVKILLENGADVTQVTNKGNTPLHTATSKSYKEIVELLLKHVSRDKLNDFINAKTTTSGTASLHIAAKNGSLDIVKSLLTYGASYNIKNKEGKAPIDVSNNQDINSLFRLIEKLFKDTKNGNVKVIENIQALKPDEFLAVTNARNNLRSTLLQVAIFNKREYISSNLLKLMGN